MLLLYSVQLSSVRFSQLHVFSQLFCASVSVLVQVKKTYNVLTVSTLNPTHSLEKWSWSWNTVCEKLIFTNDICLINFLLHLLSAIVIQRFVMWRSLLHNYSVWSIILAPRSMLINALKLLHHHRIGWLFWLRLSTIGFSHNRSNGSYHTTMHAQKQYRCYLLDVWLLCVRLLWTGRQWGKEHRRTWSLARSSVPAYQPTHRNTPTHTPTDTYTNAYMHTHTHTTLTVSSQHLCLLLNPLIQHADTWWYFSHDVQFNPAPQIQLWCWHCAPYKCSYYYYYYY